MGRASASNKNMVWNLANSDLNGEGLNGKT